MFKIKIADFVVQIDNKYDYITNLCRNYIYDGDSYDISASCTFEEIKKEREVASDDPELCSMFERLGEEGTYGYLESICIYRAICLQLPQKDAFVFHAAVIEVDGQGYAFTAKSGTGKSTHIALWKKYLGEKVQIVNGDKPIIRMIDGEFYAYGTPWCGKEGWNRNTMARLKGLAFLERAKENRIDLLPPGDSASRIMNQILIPKDSLGAISTFDLVDKMINKVKCWVLGCNISIEAAQIAYQAMSGGKDEN